MTRSISNDSRSEHLLGGRRADLSWVVDDEEARDSAAGGKEYGGDARVDIRVDADGKPFVLEINSMAALGANSSYMRAARAAGLGFADLVNRIVDVAYRRYFAEPVPMTSPSAHDCSAMA